MNRALRLAIINKFDSQADFACALGEHESKVSRVIRGRCRLSDTEAKKWQKTLGCDEAVLENLIAM